MLKVYLLLVFIENNTEHIRGEEYITDAVVIRTDEPAIVALIMDSSPSSHLALSSLAIDVRDPTPYEISLFELRIPILPKSPDTLRAEELLSTSAPVITMPEIWELLRIIGRNLEYEF